MVLTLAIKFIWVKKFQIYLLLAIKEKEKKKENEASTILNL